VINLFELIYEQGTREGAVKGWKTRRGKSPQYAGEQGTKSVEHKSGLKAYMTEPDTGKLQKIEVLRRAPEHDFDGKSAWEYRWHSGPDEGKKLIHYGRTLWDVE
jgi:hypothetical protein